MKIKELIAVVPGPRKAEAIKACFNSDTSPMAPVSILRNHTNTTIYLDKYSAALLDPVHVDKEIRFLHDSRITRSSGNADIPGHIQLS